MLILIIFFAIYRSKGADAAAPAATAAPAAATAAPAAAAKKSEPAEDPTDSEEEDEMGEIKEFVPRKVEGGKPRRVSVSAESMDPAKLKQQKSQVTCIEKPPDVTEQLMKIVSKSPLLRTLDAEQSEMIVKAFTGPLVKQPGEDIIVQGEIGDVFYLIESGDVDVYVAKKGQEPVKVHRYKPWDAFGELAIMYNAPRAATCRAASECKVWALDRVSFKVIVVAAAMEKREQYKGFLGGVPILESLTEMEIMTLADSLAEEKFEDGATICNQGDDGDFFYLVKEGTATCYQKDAEGKDQVVATLNPGHYFGEIALLTSKPRQATVKAQGPLKVLSIDKATFTRIMGPLDSILKRNMDQYTKYTAQQI
jgi:cAMP-dependent protein kinase regulator